MRRRSRLATLAILAVVVALVPLVGVAATGQPATTPAGNQSTGSVAPGQQLHAVVDVGQTELETDVEGRAFGIAVAGAGTQSARAAVIKERVDDLDRRVNDLERRFGALSTARDNGSLSEGAYRARAAGLAARLSGAAHLVNASAAASSGLPADVLAANGIDVGDIEQLRQRATELGGQEVARIAREVAGPAVGSPPGRPAAVPRSPVTRGGSSDSVVEGAANATVAGSGTGRSGR